MFRLNTTTLCLLGAILVLVCAVLYLWSGRKENMGPSDVEDSPRPGQGPSPRAPAPSAHASAQASAAPEGPPEPPILVLFKADWCHHCKALAPGWAEVEKAVAGKHAVKQVDSKDPEMAKHQVRGFPCIRYFPHGLKMAGTFVEYTGERTPQGILTFLSNPAGQK